MGKFSDSSFARSPRVSLVLLLLINMMNYVDRYILPAVAVSVMAEYGMSERDFGLLTTAFLLSYMFLSPVFGLLADRFSRWILVGLGVILWSVASASTGLAVGWLSLLIVRCLIGVGEAAYGPIAPSLIADHFPVERRGRTMAFFYAAIPVGSAIGYSLGGLMQAHWRWAFYVTLVPGLALGIWSLLMRDPRSVRKARLSEVAPPDTSLDQSSVARSHQPKAMVSAQAAGKSRFQWHVYRQLLGNKSYLLCTAGMTAMTFALGGIAIWMPTYLEVERHQTDAAKVNFLFGAITAVAGLLATMLGGMAGDWFRKRNGGAYFLVSGGAMLLGTPIFLAMLFVPFPYAWGMIFLAVFCLFFNTGPSNTVLANVTPSAIRATAYAANILVIHALGDAISPPIIGQIAQWSSYRTAFILVSILILVGGLLWLLGARHLEADTARAAAADAAANGEMPESITQVTPA